MTPPATIIGTILDIPWFRDRARRRLSILVMALVLAVLCVWPRQYMARSDLMPDDSGGSLSSLLGASGSGGGLLSLGSLLGTHQSSIESDLTIARSQAVIVDVVRALHLVGRRGFPNESRAEIKLRHKVDIQSIRGSILEITVKDKDPAFAKALVASYVSAIRGRMTALSLEQAAEKKVVAVNRIKQATIDLDNAQRAMNSFRAANQLAAPEIQLGAAVALVTGLEAKLDAEQVGLRTLQRFATNDNIQVQAAEAEIVSLRNQIAAARASGGQGGPSIGGMTPKISEYENLYRDEKYAEAAYEIYKRYLDTVTVDELSATTNLDVIEPPFVNPARQYNLPAVGALIMVLLAGVLAEFYVLRPPVGAR